MSQLDPFRPADYWTPCPRCGDDFGWNAEDYLEGQECDCGHVFDGSEDPRAYDGFPVAETRIEPGPRQRPSGLAERLEAGA